MSKFYLLVLLFMKIMLNWGNLEATEYTDRLNQLLDKNLGKIKKLAKKIDENAIKLEIHLDFDNHKKIYNISLHLIWPNNNHYVEEKGYSFEEAIHQAVKELRRVIRKAKEKRITLSRQKHTELVTSEVAE